MEALVLRILVVAALLVVPSRCRLRVDGEVPARLYRQGDVVHFETAEAGARFDVSGFRLRLLDAQGQVQGIITTLDMLKVLRDR